jgi:hypothetical protein
VNNGTTIENLQEMIFKSIPNRIDLQNTLINIISKTLGSNLLNAQNEQFNYELAKQSIAFYDGKDIPTINSNDIPPEVTDLHFKIDLSKVASLNFFEFHRP